MAEITFSLEAPYNKEACLLADFTDWQRQPLSKDEDGVFRANFELADGTYYYRFAVQSLSWFNEPDAWVEVIDPFATALNEAEDAAMITIQDGQAVLAPYDWPDDATEQVPLQTMVFYELHVGRFGAEQGNAFRSLTEKLDYLQDLGVGAATSGLVLSADALAALCVQPLISPGVHPGTARRWLAGGALVLSAALIVLANAASVPWLLAARLVQGAGFICVLSALISSMVSFIPAGMSGRAL